MLYLRSDLKPAPYSPAFPVLESLVARRALLSKEHLLGDGEATCARDTGAVATVTFIQAFQVSLLAVLTEPAILIQCPHQQ